MSMQIKAAEIRETLLAEEKQKLIDEQSAFNKLVDVLTKRLLKRMKNNENMRQYLKNNESEMIKQVKKAENKITQQNNNLKNVAAKLDEESQRAIIVDFSREVLSQVSKTKQKLFTTIKKAK